MVEYIKAREHCEYPVWAIHMMSRFELYFFLLRIILTIKDLFDNTCIDSKNSYFFLISNKIS